MPLEHDDVISAGEAAEAVEDILGFGCENGSSLKVDKVLRLGDTMLFDLMRSRNFENGRPQRFRLTVRAMDGPDRTWPGFAEEGSREHYILAAVGRVGQRGASRPDGCGAFLMEFLKSRMECDPHEDPRKVLIVAMKDMRAAMEELRDELDSLDSTGKYR